jgi:hypothetical protein
MSEFMPLQNYSTSSEAEMNVQILREAGIAAILQGPQAGIFGAGFSGVSIQGVTLLVREEDVEEALELIGGDEEEPADSAGL